MVLLRLWHKMRVKEFGGHLTQFVAIHLTAYSRRLSRQDEADPLRRFGRETDADSPLRRSLL